MHELTDEEKRDIMDFQGLQQQLQMLMYQRQQAAVQMAEVKRASDEVAKAEGQLYRFAGSVMVPKKKAELEKELKEEAEALEARNSLMQKQEDKARERLRELQKKLEAVHKH